MDAPQNSGSPNNAIFNTDRVLPYTAPQVFDAFARPELLARWWGPRGFTNTFELFDFRPSGHWKFVMHGPGGSNHPNEIVFLKLEAPSTLISFHPDLATRVTSALRSHDYSRDAPGRHKDQLGLRSLRTARLPTASGTSSSRRTNRTLTGFSLCSRGHPHQSENDLGRTLVREGARY